MRHFVYRSYLGVHFYYHFSQKKNRNEMAHLETNLIFVMILNFPLFCVMIYGGGCNGDGGHQLHYYLLRDLDAFGLDL